MCLTLGYTCTCNACKVDHTQEVSKLANMYIKVLEQMKYHKYICQEGKSDMLQYFFQGGDQSQGWEISAFLTL